MKFQDFYLNCDKSLLFWKGENDIAIGNAIGSCIFNVILIIGLCSIISPSKVDSYALIDVLVMLASVIIIFAFAFKSNKINRWQGIVMVLLYVAYLTYIIIRNGNLVAA